VLEESKALLDAVPMCSGLCGARIGRSGITFRSILSAVYTRSRPSQTVLSTINPCRESCVQKILPESSDTKTGGRA
jgi:hypothetical protein